MEVNERRLHSSPRERLERVRGGVRGGESGGMERLGRKVYSSSDTLKAFENHHVVDFNSGEMLSKHTAAQSLSLHQLGICGAVPRRGLSFCAETGLDHHIQDAGGVSMSPDCGVRLWGRGGKGLGRTESRLSSRSNSALTLTDTETDGRDEHDGGE
ncbi:teneurin-3 [Clarias gariepinus]|uniref:teneurin-3 n=1 Tax=Clarias gariepinus TaxID=13013 RepID=UPI00234C4E4E|nr:teneurin-3 [Clarias gariepinus]